MCDPTGDGQGFLVSHPNSPRVSWVIITHVVDEDLWRALASCRQAESDEIVLIVNGYDREACWDQITVEASEFGWTLKGPITVDPASEVGGEAGGFTPFEVSELPRFVETEVDGRHDDWEGRLRIVRSSGYGAPVNFSLGCYLAQGAWIARLDRDDVARPDRLAKQLDIVRACEGKHNLGLVYSAVTWITETGEVTPGPLPPLTHHEARRALRLRNRIWHPTWLIRKAALERAGFYPPVRYAEDYGLLLRLLWLGYELHATREPLTTVRKTFRRSRVAYADMARFMWRNGFREGRGTVWVLAALVQWAKAWLVGRA